MDIEMIDYGFYFKTPMSCPLPVCINKFFASAQSTSRDFVVIIKGTLDRIDIESL